MGLEDVQMFHYYLTLQPDPIAFSQLENVGRTRTVELLIQQYTSEGARRVVEEILRKMKFHQLADELSS